MRPAVARLSYTLLLCLTGLWLALWLAGPAFAVERLSIGIGDIEGEGWTARGLVLELPLRGGEGRVQVDYLRLADDTTLTDVSLRCGDLSLERDALACSAGTLSATLPWVGRVEGRGELAMRLDGSRVRSQWTLTRDGARADLAISSDHDGWAVDITDLTISDPETLLADWLPEGYGLAGTIDLQGRLRGAEETTRAFIEWQSQLTGHDDEGRLASEGLTLTGRLMAHRSGDAPWALRTTLQGDGGQAYAEPVFVDLSDHPVRLTTGLDWHPEEGWAEIRHFTLHQQGQGELTGRGRLNAEGLQSGSARLRDGDAEGLYQVYAHPFLLGSNLDQLTPAGRIDGTLVWANGGPESARLQLHNVQLDDAHQRFTLRDFNSRMHWTAEEGGPPPDSHMAWREARLLNIPLGRTRLDFSARGRDLHLAPRQLLPVLDGGLRINRLQVNRIGSDDLDLLFEADILPIDLRALTREMGWLPLSGTLSGRLPELTYRDGHLNLGGTLIASVFDGLLRVDDLSLEDPFGPAPVFRADLRMRSWNLDRFTEVLEVGRIEGLAHADILGLHMIGWEPVAFDARIWSPETTTERRRISQRAVENIAQLGGSAPVDWISRQFLQFFDSFRYRRLGISCRLEEGVCHMDGVAPANGGYYLVEGRAIPRINVIGFARHVSWPALRQQIRQALEQEDGPVVQ